MKTLCLYVTRSNLTEQAAKKVAEAFENCELIKIDDGKNRDGVLGYIKTCFWQLKGETAKNMSLTVKEDLENYDRIIALYPIWCEDVSYLMKSFLSENKDKIKGDIYLISTCMSGISYNKKAEKLMSSLNLSPKGIFTVKTRKNDFIKDIEEILDTISL